MFWHKPAAVLNLKGRGTGEARDGCYLAEFVDCHEGLSGEHLISEAVMRLLAGDGEFTIGGTPWLPQGEFKAVGFNALKAKCLCRSHNSALHPLDDAALVFFQALRRAFEDERGAPPVVVSGHDLERWLLKTLKVMAVSGNLGRDRDKLTGDFSDGINVPVLLNDVSAWPKGSGLYCIMAPGDKTENHNRFQLAPLTGEDDKLAGLWANILGVSFILMLEPLDLMRSPQVRRAEHRPGGILVEFPAAQNAVYISWEDGREHKNSLRLTHLGYINRD